MPNLGLHIGFALECAERLGHPLTDEFRGSYLLGSTSPDMRLFFGWDRRRTHFFHLARDEEGAGVQGLLDAHPHLGHSERLSRETVAFMLGYMTHLNVDESWICRMYRRYFGRGGPLSENPLVQVLDRAFQFEMDRQERLSITDLESALEDVKGAYEGVDVGFIDREELQRWQEIVLVRTGRELPWERFRGFVRRVHPQADDDEAERIMENIPVLLEQVQEHISDAEVRAFRQAAIDQFVVTAARYLNGAQRL